MRALVMMQPSAMTAWSTAAALIVAGLMVGVVSVLFVDWGDRGKAD